LNERFNRSNSLWALGLAAWRQGDRQRSAELQRQALRLKWEIDDRLGAALSVEALAAAEALDDPTRAATLLGAAESVWRTGGTRQETQQHLAGYHDECVQRARQGLGKAAYGKAFRRGLGLSPEDSVAYALDDTFEDPFEGADTWVARQPGPESPSPTALTRRERQVAELIGHGLSNKDIAGTLVIAQRTAEGHVENILAKLGFRSRSQIASWVARTGSPDS
ncbi:MAG TPA: LuxR C-terminal-related transcriptional regulator, partial [Kineosporiaceae bacterium]|nr:LuxR C-terminal-related transcriptional regulator [Kineosporiaceae bacterium]